MRHLHPEEKDALLALLSEWIELRRGIMSGETEEMYEIAVQMLDMVPSYKDLPADVVQRLVKERDERLARRRMLERALDQLSYIDTDQVVIEHNPLDLGHYRDSYLEGVEIKMPEVGPGEGTAVRDALVMLIGIAKHRDRDALSDRERIAIGWQQ